MRIKNKKMNKTIFSIGSYGIFLVLVGLIILFSVLTIKKQQLVGEDAGTALAAQVDNAKDTDRILLITSVSKAEKALITGFENSVSKELQLEVLSQTPPVVRKRIASLIEANEIPEYIVLSNKAKKWLLFQQMQTNFPELKNIKVATIRASSGSNFLKKENLLNVADQIAVIAIIAIGMTMVIITGGIDLSVGSLIALSAVIVTTLIASYMGAEDASTSSVVIAGVAAIVICGILGVLSGVFTTYFNIPSFIVTLSMMLIASGIAYTISEGQSIYQIPESFVWLGRARVFGIPVSVLLMVALYFIANIIMTKTVFGRYVYAIGGNLEAAQLSGVPIKKITIIVFAICGLLAGVGGVILASQLNSGSPTYGTSYELYVIAAVVIGGTSLMGGEGKIWGTLIGAFVIGVIQNGMNLIGIESYLQKIILGLLILVALVIEKYKKT